MDIFSAANATAETAPEGHSFISFTGGFSYPIAHKPAEVFAEMQPDKPNVLWISYGQWSAIDLLVLALERTGPAHVAISSYALSERPARIIATLKASRQILSLIAVIDKRIDVRSADALNLFKNCCDQMALVNTHAKVTVVKNNQHAISIIGSANYTTNKRIECGLLSCQADIADFNLQWINNALHSN